MESSNMSERTSQRRHWVEALGLPHIVRTLSLAGQPANLTVCLVAIVLTLALGCSLDWAWKQNNGIHENAIQSYLTARATGQNYEPSPTQQPHGVFEVWGAHQRRCVEGVLTSWLPQTGENATPFQLNRITGVYDGPCRNVRAMGYGAWWMMRYHPFFFILFGAGSLIIWSLAGGTVCRISAIRFARDQTMPLRDGLSYVREKWVDGFLLAPCVPVAMLAVAAALLLLGGVLLSIPYLGDVLGGIAFPLAIVGGLVIALMIVGGVLGGTLFWPAVAVEGSDAFDAVSRGLSYALSKPWKSVVYGTLLTAYGGICWWCLNFFLHLGLSATRILAGWGTSAFGWGSHDVEGAVVNKLDFLWPMPGPGTVYASPIWSELPANEWISAVLIGVVLLLVIGLMWSFLASFYFSGCTVGYFLLRRDIDAIDLEDICEDHLKDEESSAQTVSSTKPDDHPHAEPD